MPCHAGDKITTVHSASLSPSGKLYSVLVQNEIGQTFFESMDNKNYDSP
jgi:hypothetical protein